MSNSQNKSSVLANNSTDFSVKQSSITAFSIASIVLFVIVVLYLIFKKQINSLIFKLPPKHISITVNVKNIRTKDFFRVKATCTIYVVVYSKDFLQSDGSDSETITSSLQNIFENAIREAASSVEFLEIYANRKQFREEIEKTSNSHFGHN